MVDPAKVEGRVRAPRDYSDVFKVWEEEGIIPADFLPDLQRMARFRNRLLHLYWEVDAEMMYDIPQERLGQFERYRGLILALLEQARRERNHEDPR